MRDAQVALPEGARPELVSKTDIPACPRSDLGAWTDKNVCPTYCPMDGLVTGFQSAARRPPLSDWTKLITPM